MTQLTVLVGVLSWPLVTLNNVGLNFLVPSSEWHLEGGGNEGGYVRKSSPRKSGYMYNVIKVTINRFETCVMHTRANCFT